MPRSGLLFSLTLYPGVHSVAVCRDSSHFFSQLNSPHVDVPNFNHQFPINDIWVIFSFLLL